MLIASNKLECLHTIDCVALSAIDFFAKTRVFLPRMENSQDWIKLITFGFGLLVGWKLRAYLGMPPSARNLKDWFTLRQKLILVVRSDDPQLNTAKIASYCASASVSFVF